MKKTELIAQLKVLWVKLTQFFKPSPAIGYSPGSNVTAPMGLSTTDALKQEALQGWDTRSLKDKDIAIKYRGINHKRPERINGLIEHYTKVLPLLTERLADYQSGKTNGMDETQNKAIIEQVARIKDKLACCLTETELRETGQVKREYHDTVYYIDLTSGDDGDDGLGIGTAWLTLEQYTTTTARTPGDIAYVRANTSEIAGGAITMDEPGTLDAYISLIGCDATVNDPWGDDSNVLPIIDTTLGSITILIAPQYWNIERLELINQGSEAIKLSYTLNIEIKGCNIHDNAAGITIDESRGVVITDCDFSDNSLESVHITGTGTQLVCISNCVFNGGTSGTAYGIFGDTQSFILKIENTSFGTTTQHSSGSIGQWVNRALEVYSRNCKFDDTATIVEYND
jgi:parallel beta-helix repeat protein